MIKTLVTIIITTWFFLGQEMSAQVVTKARVDSVMNAHVLGGDSIPHIDLNEVTVRPERVFKNRRDARRYWRLVYNLKKVMPLSKIVAAMVIQVDEHLDDFETDREKRKYVKSVEDSLWKEYEQDMRKLTISQGKLLFKLIDREASATTYFWIQEYRGKVSAFFWQGIARLFSSNLKLEYNPDSADKLIDELIRDIEKGYI